MRRQVQVRSQDIGVKVELQVRDLASQVQSVHLCFKLHHRWPVLCLWRHFVVIVTIKNYSTEKINSSLKQQLGSDETDQYFLLSDSREALPVDEKEEESQMISEENESPDYYWPEDGSGDYEGSAGPFLADLPVETSESESGSGEFWTEKNMELFKGTLFIN